MPQKMCGKGMRYNPKSGKCEKKPNIKKILGKSVNVGAREPIASAFGLEDRGLRSKSIKRKRSKAKKRY
jgi:hypothetical protein